MAPNAACVCPMLRRASSTVRDRTGRWLGERAPDWLRWANSWRRYGGRRPERPCGSCGTPGALRCLHKAPINKEFTMVGRGSIKGICFTLSRNLSVDTNATQCRRVHSTFFVERVGCHSVTASLMCHEFEEVNTHCSVL